MAINRSATVKENLSWQNSDRIHICSNQRLIAEIFFAGERTLIRAIYLSPRRSRLSARRFPAKT